MTKTSGVKGIVAMAAAMGLFVTNDTFLKLSLSELPMGEALSARSAFAALAMAAMVIWSGDLPAMPGALSRRVLIRSSLETITTVVYIAALMVMPIASTTVIYMAAPLITVALSVPLLGEQVGWKRWCAVVVGFCGALIVARPDPATFSAIALLPMLAACSGSLRDISTRPIGAHIPGPVVVMSASSMLALVTLTFSLWETWHVPSAWAAFCLVGSGLTFASGSIMLVYAFRTAELGAILPLRYLPVPGALLAGFAVFGDVPDMWAGVGTLLVVGAGLYSIHCQRQEQRRQVKVAPAPAAAPVMRPIPAAKGPLAGSAALALSAARAPSND